MLPRDRASLLDILEQIRFIRDHLAGVTREAFFSDALRKDAVTYRVAIIGEAATRLSSAFRTAHPEVEWQDIRDMCGNLHPSSCVAACATGAINARFPPRAR